MIQKETRLKVADNSGVREIGCINIIGKSGGKYASLGDLIVASAKQVTPQSPVHKGDIIRAVIVRCRQSVVRPDGTQVRFDDNAAVIITLQGEPVGTRVFGPVGRELRDRKFMKIVSLAPEVL